MKQYLDASEEAENLDALLEDALEKLRYKKLIQVEEIGKAAAKLRDAAVKGRASSGCETIWKEDREYYEGIDERSRDIESSYTKPASGTGGLQGNTSSEYTNKCTAFFNITRQFCDSGSARMGDILLPAGDWNFTVKATPIRSIPEDLQTLVDDVQNNQPGQDNQAPPLPVPEQSVEVAEDQLKDWLIDCTYHTEVRKAVEDAAIIGTGIIKGPVPYLQQSRKVESGTMVITDVSLPGTFHVKPENFYPDPSCGDNIHNGAFTWEKDNITAKKLIALKKDPSYLASQIDKVLDEGPSKKNKTDGLPNGEKTKYSESFEIWYGYCMLSREDMLAMTDEEDESDEEIDRHELVPAVVVLVNDTAIKAFLNPLDSGAFPYDIMPWQRRVDSWTGIGIARQGRTAQDMFNASARKMMENAGLSSAPIIVVRQNAIAPTDGNWSLYGGKVFVATEEGDIRSVADAITAINIPMMQVELQNIITLAREMMEEATGIFFIMQGQQGSAPDTVGGMEILQRNSSAILRRLARTFDENVTEPHIKRYYEYMLLDPEVDEAAKIELQIQAIGSTALVEREIHAMQAQQLLQASANPIFGIDPEKAMEEVLKSQRFQPDKWLLGEDKKAEMAQAPPPPMPQIEVAKIRAETAVMQEEGKRAKNAADMDRDKIYAEGVARRDQSNDFYNQQELTMRRELAILDYANKHQISLDKVKAGLADTVMKLKVQKELSGSQVIEPAVEPAGRAPDGQSFQK